MKYFLLFLAFFVSSFSKGGSRKLPDFVKPCSRNDPAPEKCLKEVIEAIRPNLIKGIPEMGIPPMDPLTIPALFFEAGGSTSFSYKSNLTNLVFTGGKDFKVKSADLNVPSGTFDMAMYVPKFYISGHYTAAGKIILIEFNSEGPFLANLTDITIAGMWKAKKITKKGKEHFVFNNNEVNVDVKAMTSEFKDLFKGNKELTDNTNKVINENSDVLYEEIKPVIGGGISQLITAVLNKVHELYSNDILYPE